MTSEAAKKVWKTRRRKYGKTGRGKKKFIKESIKSQEL